ncbi:MAG: hypothetical protein WBG93_15060 [Thermoanaerobaculia bacterium]
MKRSNQNNAWRDRVCDLLRRLSVECRRVQGLYVRASARKELAAAATDEELERALTKMDILCSN